MPRSNAAAPLPREPIAGGWNVAFFKSLPVGGLLTFVISLIIGSQGSSGGQLSIRELSIGTVDFFWSWPLFAAATCLAWFIIAMLDS
jgi:hypothetical protein